MIDPDSTDPISMDQIPTMDSIRVVPWDPSWLERFEAERDRLLSWFEPSETRIEHVGSTAVPGLDAKPIIDMMLGVPRIAEVESRIPLLEAHGWEYVPEHEAELPERRFLARPRPRPRTHHLHAVELDCPFWVRHIAFRDHLRAHPVEAAAYGRLKNSLAARFRTDRRAYTDAKTDFIEDVLCRCAGL